MAKTTRANGRTTVEQDTYTIPDIHIKELLAAIPPHCLERSALRSSLYILGDLLAIGFFWKTTKFLEPFIAPEHVSLPSPFLYTFAKFSLWALYTFFTGLFSTGLWVIAHECGHQAFSESKAINNAVGWVLHSGLGVPYHAWRITHAKHHASTGHMTQDQVFVPKTRSERGLPKFNPEKEDLAGSSVTDELMNEMWEALGDSPIGAVFQSFGYLIGGWPLYITMNASGQRRYPAGTSHFNPSAPMFNPGHYGQIIISNVGVVLWLAAIAASINTWGFLTVFRTYLVPYLWVNHWLVLITFLQHTDPILPHYRAPEFTFARGALCTLDRELLGDCGRLMAWLGAFATHGISETHVAHHVCSRIPHYHAWEVTDVFRKRLAGQGFPTRGRPGGWAEVYRAFTQCKFVEDEGDVVFYKNAFGLAQTKGIINDNSASDSGVEMIDKDA